MNKYIMPVFWALVGVFIVLASTLFIGFRKVVWGGTLLPIILFAFASLAIALTVMAARTRPHDRQRLFLLLTGSSGVGLVASAILHNLVYGALALLFGRDFWTRTGIEDEPFFFIMALIVCPLAFLAGAAGSITLWTRSRSRKSLPL